MASSDNFAIGSVEKKAKTKKRILSTKLFPSAGSTLTFSLQYTQSLNKNQETNQLLFCVWFYKGRFRPDNFVAVT